MEGQRSINSTPQIAIADLRHLAKAFPLPFVFAPLLKAEPNPMHNVTT
jgi:hypothetical protein